MIFAGRNHHDFVTFIGGPYLFSGKPFLTYIDELPTLQRSNSGPVRLPIAEKYREMGTMILGKLESGTITKGQSLILMPNKVL